MFLDIRLATRLSLRSTHPRSRILSLALSLSALAAILAPAGRALAGKEFACCNDATGACFTSDDFKGGCPQGSTFAGFGTCQPDTCTIIAPPMTDCPPVNGNFETGDFTGWTQFGNTSDSGVDSTAHTGSFGAYFGPVGVTGGISQVIPANPGDTITIQFWLMSDGGTPNFFAADFDGQNLITLINDPAHGYALYSFTHVVTTANPTLSFTFRDDPGFLHLDDVTACIGACSCTWDNGSANTDNGQVSHLGGSVPQGEKAADDFCLCDDFVYDLTSINATLVTTTLGGPPPAITLVKPKAEIWSDCNGCPGVLLYTFEKPLVIETGLTAGTTPAPDSRPLRVVDVSFQPSLESKLENKNVVLKGGCYWLSVYGTTDGLGTMGMYDVTYWAAARGNIKGLPAKKIAGLPSPVYGQFLFPTGCVTPPSVANGWKSVADGCCVGCIDLSFTVCTTPCKVVIDNGSGRIPGFPTEIVGSTSQFATNSLSPFETRSADDFVLAASCQDYHICYVEGCVLTNCPTFDGVFEIYSNNCNKPSFALAGGVFGPRGGPLFSSPPATKIIPLGYSAFMDGRTVYAYRLEFHDLALQLSGGSQYWISVGVKYTFSVQERAFFCYNADCRRRCLIRWNEGRVLTATSIDSESAAMGGTARGWAKVGNDFSFLIAADGLASPGPVNSNPTCPADYNRDGSLNIQDIFDFLGSWFTGCP